MVNTPENRAYPKIMFTIREGAPIHGDDADTFGAPSFQAESIAAIGPHMCWRFTMRVVITDHTTAGSSGRPVAR